MKLSGQNTKYREVADFFFSSKATQVVMMKPGWASGAPLSVTWDWGVEPIEEKPAGVLVNGV